MSTATATAPKVADVKLLINGRWETSQADRWGDVFNPSVGRVIGRVPLCPPEEVDRAIQAAAAALRPWWNAPG